MIPKFRAWDKANKKLCEVKAWSDFNGGEVTIKRDGENASYVVSLDDIVIMQLAYEDEYRIIYDKDIVMDANSGEIGVVFYSKDDCAWKVKTDSTEDWLYDWLYDSLYYWLGCEVLGSVYENSDLLESVEE